MNNCKQYDCIMSFGCMCSTALFLRKYGYRSESTFFDWLSGSLTSYFKMLDDNFSHLLDRKHLIQPYGDFPHIIDNTFYDVSLNHMFDATLTLDKQFKKVEKFCNKRINRFLFNTKNKSCLLVYYSRDKSECDWIANNYNIINKYCEQYCFDMVFITNYKLPNDYPFPHFLIPINNIHKPYGGGVSFPFENVEGIVNYLDAHYDSKQKATNLKHKEKKHLIKKIYRHLFKKHTVRLKIE